MSAESLLALKKISKIFSRGTIDEVRALNGINLEVRPEDYVTIIGSNGAGKTTMLNVVGGVFPPEKGGKVIVDGTDITNLSEYKHAKYVGRVYQDPNIGTAAKMTVEENLAMAVLRGKSRGLRAASNKQRREEFREALMPLKLGLENRLNALVGTLSSGQRQAVALVMATISRPALLLLDEHSANLDPRTAQIVLELTEMIVKREKITTLMVTHNMELALRYGNRLIMMHEGRIVVDLNKEQRTGLTINDLITAFERASGSSFNEDELLLR
jgi:putative ABC transport system ATP-binding protein